MVKTLVCFKLHSSCHLSLSPYIYISISPLLQQFCLRCVADPIFKKYLLSPGFLPMKKELWCLTTDKVMGISELCVFKEGIISSALHINLVAWETLVLPGEFRVRPCSLCYCHVSLQTYIMSDEVTKDLIQKTFKSARICLLTWVLGEVWKAHSGGTEDCFLL